MEIKLEDEKDRKAYVVEAWEEDHATWKGDYAPR